MYVVKEHDDTYARVSILFLKELLQMPVAPAGSVGKLGGAFLDEQFSLRPGIIFLGEYPLEFPKELVLLPRHALPAFFQSVHRIALKTGDDRLQATKVLQNA